MLTTLFSLAKTAIHFVNSILFSVSVFIGTYIHAIFFKKGLVLKPATFKQLTMQEKVLLVLGYVILGFIVYKLIVNTIVLYYIYNYTNTNAVKFTIVLFFIVIGAQALNMLTNFLSKRS